MNNEERRTSLCTLHYYLYVWYTLKTNQLNSRINRLHIHDDNKSIKKYILSKLYVLTF